MLVSLYLPGQIPRIGVIDFYGLRKVSQERVRKALGVNPGDPLPASKGDAEQRIEAIPGIVLAHLEAVCCEEGKAVLYVGVEEKGAVHFEFHSPPTDAGALPEEISATYQKFLEALRGAAEKGDTAEDLTRGYSLMVNPECRALQLQFVKLATENLEVIRWVLRYAGDPEQRAAAAYVIAYAPKKLEAINDLQWAMQDPDSGVRANAMASLKAAMVLSVLNPGLELHISPTWFIEMLNSIEWTDRRRAADALVNLTETRDPAVLDEMRERALPSLIEMARWKTLAHALPPYILLGRIAGMKEEAIQDTWSRDRTAGIAAMLKSLKKM